MKTIKTKLTSRTIASEIDLFSDLTAKVPKELKGEISKEVGEYLKEQILTYVASSSTPVSGASYKSSLSKSYAKFKKSEVGNTLANLELTGEMLDQLDYRVTSAGVEVGVYGSSARKADGHNNFSGSSDLPERRFLPKEGEAFKAQITKEVTRIIEDKLTEQIEIGRKDFALIKNKQELMDTFKTMFPDMSLNKATDAALRNREFRMLLDEFNLTRFLDGQD